MENLKENNNIGQLHNEKGISENNKINELFITYILISTSDKSYSWPSGIFYLNHRYYTSTPIKSIINEKCDYIFYYCHNNKKFRNYNEAKKCYEKISYHKYRKEFHLLIDHNIECYESNKITINSISVTDCIKKDNIFLNLLINFLNNNALISFSSFKNGAKRLYNENKLNFYINKIKFQFIYLEFNFFIQ